MVLVELESQKSALLPPELKPFAGGSGRVRDSFTRFWTTAPRNEIAAASLHYQYRVGIGAAEIWKKFPEFRNDFVATIERTTLDGPVAKIEQPLRWTIADDKLVSNEFKLSDVDFRFWNGQHMAGHGPQDVMETVTIPDLELGQYTHLVQTPIVETTTVTNKHMFFCEYFSLVGVTGEIAPGVRFFSPKALRADPRTC